MLRCLLLLLIALGITACSNLYRPISSLESDAMAKSRRDVFPNDFRNSKASFGSVEIAWAGVIRSSKINDSGDHYEIDLELEHHYFDWVMDNSQFHLSPRGEGLVKTKWSLLKSLPPDTVANEVKSGRMIVVYGFPESLASEFLVVRATYLRTFGPGSFRTNTMDYGRPGEPVKFLKPEGVL
ncbi:MAG TPA: hypothetical protein PLT48_17570 [Nitrospira sp.]|nr:hypothetical protein [Nitrospira sp.]